MRLYLCRQDPVQEIAAHPDTLALLVAALPKAEPQSGAQLDVLIGLPLSPDEQMIPGVVSLRPAPARPTP